MIHRVLSANESAKLHDICRNRASRPHIVWTRRNALSQNIQVRAGIAKISEEVKSAKSKLLEELSEVKDFGIYGVKAARLSSLKQSIEALEATNPLQNPTEHLDLLSGHWKVLFSTIKITGWRRVSLGLRDIVQLDGLTQEVDQETNTAACQILFADHEIYNGRKGAFNVRGGELVLKAAYKVVSPERVSIELLQASLVPEKLQRVFESNFDLLLSIFNPQGWLDITYCDENIRCGRDDKGNIFVLERQ